MDELQNMRMPLGTTEWNHSYYTGNPLSALHSLQQLQAGASSASPVQMSALHTGVTWCSDFKLCAPAHRSRSVLPIHRFRRAPPALSQVTLCQPCLLRLPRISPLPHSWSVASLQVLHRRSSHQSPHHLWMPPRRLFHTPLALGTFLRNSRSRSSWLQLLRTMFSAPRVPDPSLRHFLTRLCRRLCTASHLTMPPHNYSSRSSSSGVSSPMTLLTAKPRHRHIAMLGAPHRHIPLTLLRFASPTAPAMPATVTSTPRPHVCYYSRHRVSRRMPVNLPHMVYLLKQHRCDLVCVHLSQSRHPQPHVSTTQVGTHPVRSATTYKPSASTALAGTHTPVGADPRARTGPFPKPRALFFLWSNMGSPNLTGLVTLIQPTAISCIINTVSLFFSGTRAQRAETPPQRLADGFMRLFFKKPATMSRTSLISSLHTLVTRTSPSCSTRTPSSPTLWFSPSRKTPQAKVRGCMVLLIVRALLRRPFSFWHTNGHILLSTHPQCRGQET